MIYSIGNPQPFTPVVPLGNIHGLDIFCKLECNNPTGSIKDRAANFVVDYLLENGLINSDTLLVESSSGNFGISLARKARLAGLKFLCVVDEKILPINERLILLYGGLLQKVYRNSDPFDFLQARLDKVGEILSTISNSYWVNQYGNNLVSLAYSETLAYEITQQFSALDYIFIGVSSGGTICGLSHRLKEHYSNLKVIAVDVSGSKVFGGKSNPRYLPGIGSSITSSNLSNSLIDDVIVVNEEEAVLGCYKLLHENSILAGGSSGAAYVAALNYFDYHKIAELSNALIIFPDSGERYLETIYNDSWLLNVFPSLVLTTPAAVAQAPVHGFD